MSAASTSLFAAVMVTAPLLVVAFAAKLRTVLSLSVKSAATAGDSASADTETSNASGTPCVTVAVTVLTPPSSEIEAGFSTSDTLGAESVTHTLTVSPSS